MILSLNMTNCPPNKLSLPLEPSRQLHLLPPQQGLSMPRKLLMLKLPLCMPPLVSIPWQLPSIKLQNEPKPGPTPWPPSTPLTHRSIVPDSVILLECCGGLLLSPYKARTSAPTSLCPLTLHWQLLAKNGPKETGLPLRQAKQILLLLPAPRWTRLYSFPHEPLALISRTRAFRL